MNYSPIKKYYFSFLAMVLLSGGLTTPVMAEPWHGRGEMHHFHERDIHVWRGGGWYHGAYMGRMGWWWIVGGVYYYYPAPVYPYPDPYTPAVVVPGPVVVAPPAAPAPMPSMPPRPAPAPAPTVQAQNLPSVWYYCEASKTYYPYVSECAAGWKTVPATPAK